MTSAPGVICSSPNPADQSRWFRARYCSPWSRTGMAIKPFPPSPFPLWIPISFRRQAVKFRRRSSLLPPRSTADFSCSGEPLLPLLAWFTSPRRAASPDPELACARALQVLLCFSPVSPSRGFIFDEPFRRVSDAPRPPDTLPLLRRVVMCVW